MEPITDIDRKAADEVLARAAGYATLAPSIHNTQPWRWRIHGGRADLFADLDRHLTATDPDRRMLTISLGAALQHLTTVLAAEGVGCRVIEWPAPAIDVLVASVTVTGTQPPSMQARKLSRAIRSRRTDRRPVLDAPLPESTLALLRAAAADYGIGLHHLTRDQVIELASATSRAQQDQVTDPDVRAELERWAGDGREPFMGVPAGAIPERLGQTTIPTRDFGHPGRLPIGDTHDNSATYVILSGPDDEPKSWLRAGQALSALWLTATDLGLAVLPLSAAAEEPATRLTLRHILSGLSYPYLAVRLGTPDPNRPRPPRVARLKPESVIDVVE